MEATCSKSINNDYLSDGTVQPNYKDNFSCHVFEQTIKSSICVVSKPTDNKYICTDHVSELMNNINLYYVFESESHKDFLFKVSEPGNFPHQVSESKNNVFS